MSSQDNILFHYNIVYSTVQTVTALTDLWKIVILFINVSENCNPLLRDSVDV